MRVDARRPTWRHPAPGTCLLPEDVVGLPRIDNAFLRGSAYPSVLSLPGRGALDLWLLRIPENLREEPDPSVLDREERAWLSQFVRESDRLRYTVAHCALRRLLGVYLGTAPEAVRFTREACPLCGDPHGRPTLADHPPPLHFSLSHAGDLVFIGVATNPLGVDVERVPAASQVDDLSSVLHPAETADLQDEPPERRAMAFARLWTRKEAYLKGIGTGLGRAPELDYVGTGGHGAAPPEDWTILDVPAPDGYAAAVAVKGQVTPGAVTTRTGTWPTAAAHTC